MTIEDLALYFTKSLGSRGAAHLVDHFGSAERIYEASLSELINDAGLRPEIAERIVAHEGTREAEQEIKKYIDGCEADEYDMLIQLCDALATDYGFVIVEKRFVDVTRRYGIMETYIKGWERTFASKEYFEEKMGCSVYDVLPDIGRTTLLSPKPWKPGDGK